MDFNDKVALVTGGANGIGRCLVATFIAAGAKVAMIDTDKDAGEKLVFRHGEDKLFFYHGDIAEKNVLMIFSELVKERFTKINFLINNAMVSKKGLQSSCSWEDFEYVQRIGVTAPYFLTLLFKESFATSAAIVNISSSRSMQSQPDTESYSAAKGAIKALTHAMSVSLAHKVRVNAISPGWIETVDYHDRVPDPQYSAGDSLQHPAGRIGKPEDIAKLVLFLCSEDAGFINGQDIIVDGGMSKLMIYHNDYGWSFQL